MKKTIICILALTGFTYAFSNLIKIKPTDPFIGVILKNNVKIYSNINLNSNVIANIQKNEYVKVILIINKKEDIGGIKDNWAKIQTSNGVTGYIFAGFLFELDVLYKRNWINYKTAGFTEKISFYRPNILKYVFYSKNGFWQKEKPLIKKGNFLIKGNKIIIKIHNKENGKTKLFSRTLCLSKNENGKHYINFCD